MEINQDTIRRMRKEGKHNEAEMLLKAHYKSVRKAGHQMKVELEAQQRKIRKAVGLCGNITCFRIREKDEFLCQRCRGNRTKYKITKRNYKRWTQKEISSIIKRYKKSTVKIICQELQITKYQYHNKIGALKKKGIM